jgi:hypothetical protein
MFYGGVGACVDARVEDPWFEDINPWVEMCGNFMHLDN